MAKLCIYKVVVLIIINKEVRTNIKEVIEWYTYKIILFLLMIIYN
jgi:hypothetical protein